MLFCSVTTQYPDDGQKEGSALFSPTALPCLELSTYPKERNRDMINQIPLKSQIFMLYFALVEGYRTIQELYASLLKDLGAYITTITVCPCCNNDDMKWAMHSVYERSCFYPNIQIKTGTVVALAGDMDDYRYCQGKPCYCGGSPEVGR